jgi:hypothetical protein
MGTHPDTSLFRVRNGIPDRGMLHASNLPSTPSTEVREALMGFRIEDTDAPGLSKSQRIHLLGECTNLISIAYVDGILNLGIHLL